MYRYHPLTTNAENLAKARTLLAQITTENLGSGWRPVPRWPYHDKDAGGRNWQGYARYNHPCLALDCADLAYEFRGGRWVIWDRARLGIEAQPPAAFLAAVRLLWPNSTALELVAPLTDEVAALLAPADLSVAPADLSVAQLLHLLARKRS